MTPHELISDLGNCREVGLDVMYPDENDARAVAVAKIVCSDCVVKDICREQALFRDESGVWGEMTQDERRNYKAKVSREKRRARPRTA